MSELLQPRGIFSGENLPKGWTSKESDSEAYVRSLGILCPEMQVVGQIARGANSTTFVLKGEKGLRVCQFGSASPEGHGGSRFVDAKERMAYLKSHGIAVPTIFSNGNVSVGNESKEYVVMDFIKGVSVDTFLATHPHKREEVQEKIGKLLAQLEQVPLQTPQGSPSDRILSSVQEAGAYLKEKGIVSSENVEKLDETLKRRLDLLGTSEMSYVHLDPFPVNIQVTGSLNNYALTLLDVEAINFGHPLVEGLGRAIKWGIHDWHYVSGDTTDTSSLVNSFLRGYSYVEPKAAQYLEEPAKLALLLDTTELVGLPASIIKESQKEEPGEYSEWSKSRLLELIQNKNTIKS